MDSLTLVTCYELSDHNAGRITGSFPQLELVPADQGSVAGLIGVADVFCGHAKVPVDWQTVVNAGRLQWIQSSAAGLDHCLTPAVRASTIRISSCSGLFRDSVAEQTMALLYGLVRKLPEFFRQQLNKEYTRRPTDDLHGKTIGLIGFGGNGQRIAELLLPLGTTIIATDRFTAEWKAAIDLPPISELWPATELNALLQRSDVVVLTLPLDNSTEKLMGAEQFARMPPGSWLINVGRGRLIDEEALVMALQTGNLAGAGLDVAFHEPLPKESPLWELPNLIITPHVGAQSARRNDLVTDLFIKNMTRFLSGEQMVNEVNKEIGIPMPSDRD